VETRLRMCYLFMILSLSPRTHTHTHTHTPLHSYDAFRSVFPAGTVSGAPKVRAMQLVASLEKERRHIYAGAVGYVSFNGEMDTAIAIRTMVIHDGQVFLQAGGGIVYDSKPYEEYVETINKLAATVAAVMGSNSSKKSNSTKKKRRVDEKN